MRASDQFTIPLAHFIHMRLHDGLEGEVEFLAKYGIDGLKLAAKLYEKSRQNDNTV